MIARNAAGNGTTSHDGKDVVSRVVMVLKECGPEILSIEDVSDKFSVACESVSYRLLTLLASTLRTLIGAAIFVSVVNSTHLIIISLQTYSPSLSFTHTRTFLQSHKT